MPRWLMKIGDDEYVEWSTIVDEIVEGPFTLTEAVEYAIEGCREEGLPLEAAQTAGIERLRFTDQHLCSCRARIGENWVVRNGRSVPTGGGRLAYHFDNYEQVHEFMASHYQGGA